MKKRLIIMIPLIAFSFLMCNQSETEESNSETLKFTSDDNFKRYGFESGIVEYEFSGKTQTGTEKLYFVNWGMLEAKYLDIEVGMMGFMKKQKTMTMLKGDSTYSYDYHTGRLSRIKTPMWEGMKKQAKDGNLEEVGMAFIKQMDGKKVGNETIAGKPCEIWDVPQMLSKVWLWKGIPLKTEAGPQELRIIQTAVKVEMNANVPTEKFEIPDDIEPQETMDLQNLEQLMEKFKAPKK